MQLQHFAWIRRERDVTMLHPENCTGKGDALQGPLPSACPGPTLRAVRPHCPWHTGGVRQKEKDTSALTDTSNFTGGTALVAAPSRA